MHTYLSSCEKYIMIVSLYLLYCMFQSSYLKATRKRKKEKEKKTFMIAVGMLLAYVNASLFFFFLFFLSVCLDSTECAFLAFYVLSVGPIGTVHRPKKVIQTQISNKFWVSVLFTYLKIILL